MDRSRRAAGLDTHAIAQVQDLVRWWLLTALERGFGDGGTLKADLDLVLRMAFLFHASIADRFEDSQVVRDVIVAVVGVLTGSRQTH